MDNCYLGKASYAYWREGGTKVLKGIPTTKIKYIISKKKFGPREPEPPLGSVLEGKWDIIFHRYIIIVGRRSWEGIITCDPWFISFFGLIKPSKLGWKSEWEIRV